MTLLDFHEPIFVWHDAEHPERGTRRLDCVEDAIAALFRADISAYGSAGGHRQRAVWKEALHRLSSAKAEGHAASVLSARDAMRQLAHAVGILAPGGEDRQPDSDWASPSMAMAWPEMVRARGDAR